jgi:hypothetical protein
MTSPIAAVQPVAPCQPAADELTELAQRVAALRINWHDPAKFFETRSDLVWRLRRAAQRAADIERALRAARDWGAE